MDDVNTVTLQTKAPAALGDLLRQHRLQAGWSQEELAERADVSVRSISDIERGRQQRPHVGTVRRLADALELDETSRQLVMGAAVGSTDTPVAVSLVAKPSNLPVQTTPFVGRDKEIEQVADLLRREDVRLVTLTGPGGSGKTRLAVQAGAAVLDDFERGVFFVGLGQVADTDMVPSAIASTLKVREVPGQSALSTITAFLQDRNMLLILDNFEQVLAAAAAIHELLVGCPHLTVLVTSRAVLRLSSEYQYQVPPMDVPDVNRLPNLDELSEYEAVKLFTDRARAVKSGFEVTSDNAAAVAEICARVDGLPLAIELAAARIKVFPPQALLRRLNTRLQLLTSGSTDLPARQQTLRNAIVWSYDLLEPAEQVLFRRLAVFAGGCSLEAADAVCSQDHDLQIEVLDGLASLVDKNLVRQGEAPGPEGYPEPRFSMLETIREFAEERLLESSEAEVLRRRHAEYFSTLAFDAYPILMSAQRDPTLQMVTVEQDNIRATMRWSLDHHEPEVTLPIVGRLMNWYLNAAPAEGLRWTEELLNMPEGQTPTAARVWGLLGVTVCSWGVGRIADASGFAAEALRIARLVGDEDALAAALVGVGATAPDHTSVEAAGEAREILRRRGPIMAYAYASWVSAFTLPYHGDLPTVQAWLQGALEIGRETDDAWVQAVVLMLLGFIATAGGELEVAQGVLTESLRCYRLTFDRLNLAAVLLTLGGISRIRGDLDTAARDLRESLILSQELSDPGNIAACIEGLAGVDLGEGRFEHGARLLGAAKALRDATGASALPTSDALNAGIFDAIRAALAGDAFDAAIAEGSAMTQAEAVTYALVDTPVGVRAGRTGV
jgi:predicted ATPase/DNA-binding XRE family transcriptional regulator